MRPSGFADPIADEICTRLIEGETLRAICRDERMPSLSMVFRWIAAHPAFREQYVRARELQAENWADEIVEIADSPSPEADVQRDKLRVDARKWVMSKAAPKKYGDKVENTHVGPNGGPIETVERTDRDRAKAIAALLAKAKAAA